MNDVEKTAWAAVYSNGDFICVETNSGYRSHVRDPKGRQNLLPPDASNEALGAALIEALSHSRFVLPAPRDDVWIHPDAEFDADLYDYKESIERYEEWVESLVERYRYKSRRALFKNMEHCTVAMEKGNLKIVPMQHVKIQAWQGLTPSGAIDVSADSSTERMGEALRLGLERGRDQAFSI